MVYVENGKDVIRQLDNQSFDLILMDINMPQMDGLIASKIIRFEMQKTIPIIALTANACESDRQASREAGMDEHLSQPFNRAAMLAAIEQFFKSSV